MSGIDSSMRKKGYETLHADNMGGIGFKRSINKNAREIDAPVWFDTGLTMKGIKKNGESEDVRRLVCAYDGVQYDEYMSKGWKPIKKKSVVTKKISKRKKT